MRIRQTATALMCITALSAITLPAVASAKVNLTVWIPWGGDRISAFQKICSIYEKSHPNVKVTWSTFGGDYGKFLAACVAGTPPEIYTTGGPELTEYVEKQLLTPLKSYYATSRLPLDDFFYPGRQQMLYKGEVWAMPFETNPCFALWWNKRHFAEVGLSEDKPPETLEELELYMAKLTKKAGDGRYARLGYSIPTGTYSFANTLYNLSWSFGGSLYDDEKQAFTLTDPKVIKAASWWVDMARKYDYPGKIAPAGLQGFDKLASEKVSMGPVVPNLIKYALPKNTNIKWGMTGMQPYPSGGVKGVTWDGGWTLAIPKGAKHKKEAWNFMKWFLTSDESTTQIYKSTGVLVGYRKAAVFKALVKDEPDWGPVAVDMLVNSKHGRPVSPACGFMMQRTDATFESQVLFYKQTPQQYLAQLNAEVNKELDKWKKRAKR